MPPATKALVALAHNNHAMHIWMRHAVKKVSSDGLRHTCFMHPDGFLSIGYGHNLKSCPLVQLVGNEPTIGATRISDRDARALLRKDAEQVIAQLSMGSAEDDHEWFNQMGQAQRTAIVSISLRIGVRNLVRNKELIDALRRHSYEEARNVIMVSKLGEVLGRQAAECANMIRDDMFWGEIEEKRDAELAAVLKNKNEREEPDFSADGTEPQPYVDGDKEFDDYGLIED